MNRELGIARCGLACCVCSEELKFMDCIEKNENDGIVYHRDGIVGDYDSCKTVDEVLAMLLK